MNQILPHFLITIALSLFFAVSLKGQKKDRPVYPPTLSYAKILKANIQLDNLSFKAYVCDIDSSFVYYYNNKRATKSHMASHCKDCKKVAVDQVMSISYQKLSAWGYFTNCIAYIGSIVTIGLLTESSKNEYAAGFATVIGVPSACINIGSVITMASREKSRNITREELRQSSFEDSWQFIACKSYLRTQLEQRGFYYKYHNYSKKHPGKSKRLFHFVLSDGGHDFGYIIKVTDDKVHITKSKPSLIDMRKNQSDGEVIYDITDIDWVKRYSPHTYRKDKG